VPRRLIEDVELISHISVMRKASGPIAADLVSAAIGRGRCRKDAQDAVIGYSNRFGHVFIGRSLFWARLRDSFAPRCAVTIGASCSSRPVRATMTVT
jgi:hypothetical protein